MAGFPWQRRTGELRVNVSIKTSLAQRRLGLREVFAGELDTFFSKQRRGPSGVGGLDKLVSRVFFEVRANSTLLNSG